MSFLISFTPTFRDDTAEQVSEALLAPVRLAFGKYVCMEEGREIPRSFHARAIGITVCVLAFSLVLPLTILGFVINLFSKTHADKYQQYKFDHIEEYQAELYGTSGRI